MPGQYKDALLEIVVLVSAAPGRARLRHGNLHEAQGYAPRPAGPRNNFQGFPARKSQRLRIPLIENASHFASLLNRFISLTPP
jgi:hypothetical protein